MPKRSQEHLDARRRQILDGARRVFAHHGYEGATVARLEMVIGLSRGAIFNYFPSKRELFYALATEDARHAASLWIEDGFDAVVRSIAEQSPDWLGVYLEHARHLRTSAEARERWEQRVPDLELRLVEQIEAAQAAGTMRDDLSAEQILGFLAVVLDGVSMHVGVGFGQDVDSVLTLVHSALAPRA